MSGVNCYVLATSPETDIPAEADVNLPWTNIRLWAVSIPHTLLTSFKFIGKAAEFSSYLRAAAASFLWDHRYSTCGGLLADRPAALYTVFVVRQKRHVSHLHGRYFSQLECCCCRLVVLHRLCFLAADSPYLSPDASSSVNHMKRPLHLQGARQDVDASHRLL